MFFFFKQKTAYEMRISDWSSDVCSSDLLVDGTRAGIDADEVGFAATVIKIGANSEVGFFQRLAELAVGNSEIGQLGRIGFDDEVFRVATDRVDTRHARHRLQLRADDPVQHGSQIAGLLNLVGQPFPLRSQITSVGLPAGLSGNLLLPLSDPIVIAE